MTGGERVPHPARRTNQAGRLSAAGCSDGCPAVTPGGFPKAAHMKTAVRHETIPRGDARRLPAPLLPGLGVSRLNRYGALLQCATCRTTWSPRLQADGALPPGYWQCPNKCNC